MSTSQFVFDKDGNMKNLPVALKIFDRPAGGDGWRSSLTDMYFSYTSVQLAKGTALIMKGTIADLQNTIRQDMSQGIPSVFSENEKLSVRYRPRSTEKPQTTIVAIGGSGYFDSYWNLSADPILATQSTLWKTLYESSQQDKSVKLETLWYLLKPELTQPTGH